MLGAIADDFTGATDLATMLRRSGHRTVVAVDNAGLDPERFATADAVVVATKTRTAPVGEATADARAALEQLRALGATRFYVKYCSTFDSTDEGNIGPILDEATALLGVDRCIVVPSLPANRRTVYQGHLFVGDDLLENSSMRTHPLTPMTRSRVSELLSAQTTHRVAEIHHDVIRRGPGALARALEEADGRYVVIDAISDDDLATIGAATSYDVLVSGGSGLALGISGPRGESDEWEPPAHGRGVTLCGSVSTATMAQIRWASRIQPTRQIDLDVAAAAPAETVAALTRWILDQGESTHPVLYGAQDSSQVRRTVRNEQTAAVVERTLAGVAHELVDSGRVSALIVAGGESSGAIVRKLGVQSLRIGPEIAPGVCWSSADWRRGKIALALKSGNFGQEDLFVSAWDVLA